VFTLGSLACALSSSLTALVVSRILQGLGGAGIMSVNNALIRFIYPPDQLGRGIGINALVGAISGSRRPERRGIDPADRTVAMVVRDQCSAQRRRFGPVQARTAADPARPSSVRLA
jgi:hypothetical protein